MARKLISDALEIARNEGLVNEEIRCLNGLSLTSRCRKERDELFHYAQEALELLEKTDKSKVSPWVKEKVFHNMAYQNVYLASRLLNKGMGYYEETLAEVRKQGDKQHEVFVLNQMIFGLTNAWFGHGPARALSYAKTGLELSQEIDFEEGEALSNLGMSRAYFNLMDMDRAKDYYLKGQACLENKKKSETDRTALERVTNMALRALTLLKYRVGLSSETA